MITHSRIRIALLFLSVTLVNAGSAEAGLTPIRTWAPPDAIEFKTASVCHFQPSDYYGVFAVFQVRSLGGIPVDELWYLRVDGLSTWWEYGRIVSSTMLARESVISHVDCTTDSDRTAFVVWDRSDDPLDGLGARWARIDLLGGTTGPYDVPACDSGPSHSNGIAYHDGALAISGGGRAACAFCLYVLPNASDPSTYVKIPLWDDGQTTHTTDVIWNNQGAFLFAGLVYQEGTGKPAVLTANVAPDGTFLGWHTLREVSWAWSNWKAIYLALSDHDLNKTGNVLVQTDQRTFWVDRSGAQQGSSRVVGPLANFPTCEYWGSQKRIAHTFLCGLGGTNHWEWPPWSGAPLNIHAVDGEVKLSPRACSSSSDFTDPEILLVRKGMTPVYTLESLHLNLEPQNDYTTLGPNAWNLLLLLH